MLYFRQSDMVIVLIEHKIHLHFSWLYIFFRQVTPINNAAVKTLKNASLFSNAIISIKMAGIHDFSGRLPVSEDSPCFQL